MGEVSCLRTGEQLSLPARDAKRIGRLVLNEGRWNSEQIVSADWIAEMLRPVSWPGQDGSYGYLWWRTELRVGETEQTVDTAMMISNGGSIVAVIPEFDTVVVVQYRTYNAAGDFDMSRTLIERFILERLATSGF